MLNRDCFELVYILEIRCRGGQQVPLCWPKQTRKMTYIALT